MSGSNCCFVTCIQISQEEGLVFPFLEEFSTVCCDPHSQRLGIVSEAEVDVFLELSCFFYDPTDVGNLISGSSAFSKTRLNIWKFLVHVLLKPCLVNFEHYFASVWDECNCLVVWTFFGIAFLWDWNENWSFPVLWALLSFPNLLAYWVQHHHLLRFQIAQLKFHHFHQPTKKKIFSPSEFNEVTRQGSDWGTTSKYASISPQVCMCMCIYIRYNYRYIHIYVHVYIGIHILYNLNLITRLQMPIVVFGNKVQLPWSQCMSKSRTEWNFLHTESVRHWSLTVRCLFPKVSFNRGNSAEGQSPEESPSLWEWDSSLSWVPWII